MLRQISLANLGFWVGGLLTVVGTIAYATGNATLNLAGFFYGIPLVLGALALKTSELKPVPFSEPTSKNTVALRERQATEIQNKIRTDVTRYRYGQDAHLDSSLDALKLAPNEQMRPVLTGLREENRDGVYTLLLEFDSPQVSLDVWQEKQERISRFFGPGIRAEIVQPAPGEIVLALVRALETSPETSLEISPEQGNSQ